MFGGSLPPLKIKSIFLRGVATMAFTGGWADILIVYRLSQIPENSGWDVNGKSFFGSSHWKIPGTNGNSEKVVPFSRLGRSEWKFVTIYKFLEFRTSFML